MSTQCYACGKAFSSQGNVHNVFLQDDDHRQVSVGPDCYSKVIKAGYEGHAPRRGGPRLFLTLDRAQRYAMRSIETEKAS